MLVTLSTSSFDGPSVRLRTFSTVSFDKLSADCLELSTLSTLLLVASGAGASEPRLTFITLCWGASERRLTLVPLGFGGVSDPRLKLATLAFDVPDRRLVLAVLVLRFVLDRSGFNASDWTDDNDIFDGLTPPR